MKERPILFSAPMVRAILEGRKTQTRRIVTTRHPLQFIGGRGEEADPARWGWLFDGPDHHGYMVIGRGLDERFDHGCTSIPCPYGEPGDRLWVKETHAQFMVGEGMDRPVPQCVAYRATCDADGGFDYANGRSEVMRLKVTKWTPSIFMPRWASRVTLEVAEVRVQRLQEISEDDARAEGVESIILERKVYPSKHAATAEMPSFRAAFERLWESINGKRAPWSSNPWVRAITFRRIP